MLNNILMGAFLNSNDLIQFNDTNATIKYGCDSYTVDDSTYLEIACTGFSKDDIDIELDESILTIKAEKDRPTNYSKRTFYIHDLSTKNFKLQLPLKSGYYIESAKLENGLLEIEIKKDISNIKKIVIK